MKVQNLGLIVLALTLSACGGMKGLTAMAGIPQTNEVELSVAAICTACSPATHATVNPFTEPVKYTTVGVAEVDSFIVSANNLYGSVMVAEKLKQLAAKAGDEGKVEGFEDRSEILTITKGLVGTASADAPKLITTGAGLVTSAPGKFVGVNAVNLPTAVEQINLAVERLNMAQKTLTNMASGGDAPAADAPAADAPAATK